MTPTAITPAGRGKTKKPPQAAAGPAAPPKRAASGEQPAARGAGHRTELRRQPAPRAPRRVSGPAGGVAHGRRLAGPQSPVVAPRKRTAATAGPPARRPFVARWAAVVRALPDHSLLDRIIRGRAWIPLLGVLLAGIVAMQVEVLKLNASMGRSLERGTALQSQNELLRANVARLADDQRIESLAAGMGMVMPAPSAIKFLSVRQPGALQRALANVHPPDATSFASELAVNNASPSSPGTSAIVPTGTTSTSAAATTPAAQTDPTTQATSGGGVTATPTGT